MEVFVIGGGPAGFTAAIKALENNHHVTILERNNKVLKKLLLTGNGRCNFWNTNQSLDKYHSSNKEDLASIFNLKKDAVLPFWTNLGIVSKNINGYLYPYSNQATSIYNALYQTALNLKANIICDCLVTKIEKKDHKFIITTAKKVYYADKIILATGSKARPNLGSDGLGYNLAMQMGHSINPVYPALTALIGKDKFYKEWQGIRSEVILTLYEDHKFCKQESGEIQLTSDGLSGIVAFNFSSLINKGLALHKQEIIKINFTPWCSTKEELKKYLDTKSTLIPLYSLGQILEGFLNYKLVNLILKLLKISYPQKWKEVNQAEVLNLLWEFPVVIIGTKGFDDAQTSTGGIPLEEINPMTMESKIVKGLYFVGEILDVDGDCGGYNLGFAWISGLIAGELK